MDLLCRIFLEMGVIDANLDILSIGMDFHIAVGSNRMELLSNLESFWKVRIEIVLTVKIQGAGNIPI